MILELLIHGKKIGVEDDEAFKSHYQNVQKGVWEPDTFHVFDTFLDENHTYFDIGAWIGVTSLYGAGLAKHCYAFEPDPIACKHFQSNLLLNPKLQAKITLSRCAISDKNGEDVLGSVTSDVGGDSNSSLLFKNGRINWTVPTTTLESYIKENNLNDFNFIKMDIEGAESIVLPAMSSFLSEYKPTLFIAIHPVFYGANFLKTAKALIEVLKNYKHIFISHGEELELSHLERIRSFYEIIATDIPVKDFKDTSWKKRLKLR